MRFKKYRTVETMETIVMPETLKWAIPAYSKVCKYGWSLPNWSSFQVLHSRVCSNIM